MRDFYIILAKIGWWWAALLAVVWMTASLIRQTRQGKENDATFGRRFTGTGPYAWSIGRRFEMAASRLGFNRERLQLATDAFRRPAMPGEQLKLF